MRRAIFLFGASEKGDYRTPYYCQTLVELSQTFGNSLPETQGLDFAVQALLMQKGCIFFRVKEEGFSVEDYFFGIKLLENSHFSPPLLAIGIPGVGDKEIVHATGELCLQKKSALILSEKDLYDYLTSF